MPDTPPPPAQRSLAEKIDHLFGVVRPAKGGEYTHEQVATGIRDRGGPTISAAYVWQLRRGIKDNPTKKHLEALAGFFGVPAAYFFDDEISAQIDAELELLVALRDASVRAVALRTSDLSTEGRQMIAEMVERVRRLEGLPGDLSRGEQPGGGAREEG